MLKIENVDVYGWEAAIRGMRNPMNSWDKSDSVFAVGKYSIGGNDLELMRKLSKAGTDHGKFLRMIVVTLDIVAPLYWWKEFDTYKVGTVASSCSTMHKITDREFTLDDFSHENLFGDNDDELADESFLTFAPTTLLKAVIAELNKWRWKYLTAKSNGADGYTLKRYWYQIIQLLPSSYNQRRTVQLNYAVLKNMYHARKEHKLDEWHDFCAWIETLPYAELITGKEADT